MKFSKFLSITMALSFSGSQALASGYHFGTQSAAAQGTANAGAAEAADASVLFYNPAGMSKLSGKQFSGALNYVMPDGQFTDSGSTTAVGRNLSSSGNGGDYLAPTVVPHLYYIQEHSEKVNWGVGVFVPFGSKSEYDPTWAGRYASISTELTTIAINPSLSYKMNDKHSFGFGLTYQMMDGALARAADFGASITGGTATALCPGNQVAGTCSGLFDGRADITGDGNGIGFNLGWMADISDSTRLGFAYRSAIKHTLKGDADWTLTSVAGVNSNLTSAGFVDQGAELEVETPDSYSVHAFHQLNEKMNIVADLSYTMHSKLDFLEIKYANGVLDNTKVRFDWRDTYRLSAGMNYQMNETWKLRGGLAYDQAPTKNDEARHPSLPDSDRTWISVGANYKMAEAKSVDFALTHVSLAKGNINYTDEGGFGSCTAANGNNTSSCQTVRGSYDISSILLGVQFNQSF